MGKIWNGENALLMVDELYVLPDNERIKQAQMIRSDLKAWVKENFCFSDLQMRCLNKLPDNYLEETGFMLSRAIEKKYPLDIFVSDDSLPVSKRKRSDQGEAGWSENDGFYVKYTFKF
jgi:hypothetical protein